MTSTRVEWFESWFGEDYVDLYTHRDEAEAEKVVSLIAARVGACDIRRVLDLACGPGRHSKYLARHWWTSGVDLSEVLLKAAQHDNTPAHLVRADIRELPYRDSTFDLVVNLFTSFGYFATDEEHDTAMQGVHRVMANNGTFVIDFLNERVVRQKLVPRDEKWIGDKRVQQKREITPDGRFVVKHIDIQPSGRTYVERVRLFSRGDLVHMLERAGFTITESFGDYDGSSLGEYSPRVILFARRV